MGKRGNENAQMRREEYEAMESHDSGNPGEGMEKASDATLKKRRILNVSSKWKSKFSKTTKPTTEANTNASNPFANMNTLPTGAAAAPAPVAQQTSQPPPRANPFANIAFAPQNTSNTTASSLSSSNTTNKVSTNASTDGGKDDTFIFLQKLVDLKKARPLSGWPAICQEYIDEEKEKDKNETENQQPLLSATAPAPAPSLSFGNKTTALSSAPSPAPAPSAPAAAPAPFFSFNNSTATTASSPAPAFNFNNKDTAAAAPAPSFSFNKTISPTPSSSTTAAAPPPTSSPFSFNLKTTTNSSSTIPSFNFNAMTKPPTTTAPPPQAPTPSTPSDETPKDKPAAIEKEENTTETTLGEFRAKKYKLIDSQWKDLGIGILRLLQDKTNPKQRRIVMRNEVGKVKLNLAVGVGMSFEKVVEKKRGAFVRFVGKDEEDEEVMKYMIKVNEKNVEKLHGLLEEMAR